MARLLDYRNPSQPEVNVMSVEDAIKNEARLFAPNLSFVRIWQRLIERCHGRFSTS